MSCNVLVEFHYYRFPKIFGDYKTFQIIFEFILALDYLGFILLMSRAYSFHKP